MVRLRQTEATFVSPLIVALQETQRARALWGVSLRHGSVTGEVCGTMPVTILP